ncbi:atlastin-like [Planococcus citri]|uniref:atlastin-like n=1 Tax=Planococcus citri TaxID=170843 RepID=UPI0031FA3976
MDKSQAEPHPIPIVEVVPKDGKHEHAFISMYTDALDEILLQDDIKDCNCVVLSVAGASRGGKSFLLNFILRYLTFLCTPDDQKTTDNWLGNEDGTLEGFSWTYGSKRNTTGILMWSEIFRLTLLNDQKIAVIVLDTQGIFDRRSSFRESNTFFTLSTMLSSIQIYNLNRDIPEDALQNLEYFIEYGKLIVDTGHTPFQELLFLIRDWSWIAQYKYGSKGGQDYLEAEVLKISDEQPFELQALRENIKKCFTGIRCFLMPHPGLKVVQNENFNGSLSDIGSEFKESLEEFVPMLFPSGNLTLKEISGKKVTVAQWLVYFKWYVELFNREDLPEPRSMLMATATAEMVLTVKSIKEAYNEEMEIVSENYTPYMTPEELEFEHENRKKKALRMFDEKRVMGAKFSVSHTELNWKKP